MAVVKILEHPLIKHKISILRNKDTGSGEFRRLVNEIAMLMCYEATRDLPLENVDIITPVAETRQPMLSGKKPAVVPILRAGLGMVSGIVELIPLAKIGHIGLTRDEQTHKPHAYYSKLPEDIDQRLVIVPDPMLATGGSAVHAIDYLKAQGCKKIKFLCIIAAPEGLETLKTAHPDIDIFIGTLDERLNENAYIVPGLGDAGDRIFGTL